MQSVTIVTANCCHYALCYYYIIQLDVVQPAVSSISRGPSSHTAALSLQLQLPINLGVTRSNRPS